MIIGKSNIKLNGLQCLGVEIMEADNMRTAVSKPPALNTAGVRRWIVLVIGMRAYLPIALSILVAVTGCAVTSPTVPDEEKTLRQIGSLEEQVGSYIEQGKYDEAESVVKRAVATAEKGLGPGHPLVPLELNTLAWLYLKQGRYHEAEPFLERALQLMEQQEVGSWGLWWANHPNRKAMPLGNLAEIYAKQGRYNEAVPLLESAFEIHENALGPDMPVAVLKELEDLYKKAGKEADVSWVRERISGTGNVAGSRTFEYDRIGRIRFTFPPGLKYYISVPQTTAGPRIIGEDACEEKFEIQIHSYRTPQSSAKWKQHIIDKLKPQLVHAVESGVQIKSFDTADRLFYATLTDKRPFGEFLLITAGVYINRHAVIFLHRLSNDRSGQRLDRVLRLINAAEFLDVDKWPNLSRLGPTERFGLRITPEPSGDKLKIEGRGYLISLPGAEEDWSFEPRVQVGMTPLAVSSYSMKMFVTMGIETSKNTAEQYILEYMRVWKQVLSKWQPPKTITDERFISRGEVPVYAYKVSGRQYFIATRKTVDGRILELQVSALMYLDPSEADVAVIERHVTETMAPSLAGTH